MPDLRQFKGDFMARIDKKLDFGLWQIRKLILE
jgi:hypothetical protein